MLTTIILAAGLSSRMGESKLLLPWGNSTVLGTVIENINSISRDVIVVTGGYRTAVEAVAAARGARVVHNPNFARGEMISSLQVGLRTVGARRGVLVMLGDMPLTKVETLREMARFWEQKGGIVAPMFEGKRGHPVIFSADFIPPLLALSWQHTPRAVIQANRDELHLLPVQDAGVLIDLDTPDSYARWKPH